MAIPKELRVSRKQAKRAEKWMATPEYRKRVEEMRAKWADTGVPVSAGELADHLNIPLGYVIAMMAKHNGKPGGITIVPPKGKAWN